MPTVSVIVPNYNHAQYLTRRIDSILNQTYQDFELIILDDCSNDNSREVINTYKNNPKISHIVFNKINTGNPFEQWYNGVKLAKGEFVWIAESDDSADKNFLSELIPNIQKSTNIGLIYCNSIIEKNNLPVSDFSTEKNRKYNTLHWSKSYILPGVDEINKVLLRDCTINNASAVVMRKELLERILPIHNQFRFSGDWFCYLLIAACSDICYLDSKLNHYREHLLNTSKQAGYNYIKEAFYIYNWALKNRVTNRKSILTQFNLYMSDLYASGLKWDITKDFRELRPINFVLYKELTKKSLKRWIKRCLFKTQKK